jgi:hypothetical protein
VGAHADRADREERVHRGRLADPRSTQYGDLRRASHRGPELRLDLGQVVGVEEPLELGERPVASRRALTVLAPEPASPLGPGEVPRLGIDALEVLELAGSMSVNLKPP